MEIQGYPSYLIYSDGRVESKKRGGRFLKPTLDTHGYYYVSLMKEGGKKGEKKRIHRFVAEAYIQNPENKLCVDHINRDRTDNRVENLRWATYSENNDNKGLRADNRSGEIGISRDKAAWRYRYQMGGERHYKGGFKTMEEAIAYRDQYFLKLHKT